MTEDSKKIQKLLFDNKDRLSPEEYSDMLTDSEDLTLQEFTEKYDTILKNKAVGWSGVRKPKAKDLYSRIREDFGDEGFEASENWKREVWENKYQDVPYEKFSKSIDKMKQYYQDELAEREREAGKIRRKKEVREWSPWRAFLTSDYEKQRYINDPEKALFGDESPDLGEAPETRTESMADLGLGAAAVAADIGTGLMAPGVGSFIAGTLAGPTIRGARDLYHKGSDSDYQKDWSDVGKEFVSDVESNALVGALPNWRSLFRGSRNVTSTASTAIEDVLKNEELAKETKVLLERFPTKSELPKISDSELYARIEALPQSQLKDNLKMYSKDIYSIDRAGIADELDRAYKLVDLSEQPEFRNALKTVIDDGGYEITPKLGERAYESKIISQPELSKAQKAVKTFKSDVLPAVERASGPIIKPTTVAKRKEKVERSKEKEKEWFRNNYKRDWDMGFEPVYKEGDPKWEAFEELYPERALEIKSRAGANPKISAIFGMPEEKEEIVPNLTKVRLSNIYV